MKNTRQRKKKAKKTVRIVLCMLLCITVGVIATVHLLNTQNRGQKEDLIYAVPDFSTALEALGEEKDEFLYVSNVCIHATNETGSAIGGSVVQYWAEFVGLDSDLNVKKTATKNVKIFCESEQSKVLTENYVQLEDTDKNGYSAHILVSIGECEKEFVYNVIHQDTSMDNFGVLVNRYAKIDRNFAPTNLYQSKDLHYVNTIVNHMQRPAMEKLDEMFKAAKKDGITLWCCSGYRPYEMQEKLYKTAVNRYGENQTDTAYPGASEHQTGLAMDITWQRAGGGLSESMENHEEYRWLLENSYKYGFVLRYPKGKDKITGYIFEPWHFRFIGVELAQKWHDTKTPFGEVTLDEFLSIVP